MPGPPFAHVVARVADRMLGARAATRNAAAAAFELGRRNDDWRRAYGPTTERPLPPRPTPAPKATPRG